MMMCPRLVMQEFIQTVLPGPPRICQGTKLFMIKQLVEGMVKVVWDLKPGVCSFHYGHKTKRCYTYQQDDYRLQQSFSQFEHLLAMKVLPLCKYMIYVRYSSYFSYWEKMQNATHYNLKSRKEKPIEKSQYKYYDAILRTFQN